MNTLQKIVKVTQPQYDILKTGGTIGGYTGINNNYIYLVQEDYADITYANLNSIASIGPIDSSNNVYPIGLSNDNKLAVSVPWVNSDTKNTAGSYNNENKLFLIGATNQTSQTGSIKTYSNQKVYTQSKGIYADAFYAASDRRLKENIKDLDLNCLDLINNINLREFSWKDDEEHKPVVGAIAQELKQVLPEKYVHEFIGGKETDDEYLSINDSKLIYLLIGAIQEQQKEIESLKTKIDNNINQ